MREKLKRSIMLTSITVASSILQVARCEESAKVIKIIAKRYEFVPSEVVLKKGQPVVLELSTEDRSHGFSAPQLNLRSDIPPGKPVELKLVPSKTGSFDFFCDVFCGSGHDGMTGTIKVID